MVIMQMIVSIMHDDHRMIHDDQGISIAIMGMILDNHVIIIMNIDDPMINDDHEDDP